MKDNKEIFILMEGYDRPGTAGWYGTALAKNLKRPARLIAVESIKYQMEPTAITGVGMPTLEYGSLTEIKEAVEPRIKSICLDLKEEWRHIDYDFSVDFPETKVLSLAEERSPLMMVMKRTNEDSTLNEWFGTHETRLAEGTNCPTLVIPEDYFWRDVAKILYVMDINDAKIDNIRFLTDVAADLGAVLQVVTIIENNDSNSEAIYDNIVSICRGFLNYKDTLFHKVYSSKTSDEVNRIVGETNPDWLAIEQKDKGFFERIFDGYNTKKLMLQSERPVLVF